VPARHVHRRRSVHGRSAEEAVVEVHGRAKARDGGTECKRLCNLISIPYLGATAEKRISAYFPFVNENHSRVLTLVPLAGYGRFSGVFLALAHQVRRLGPKARRILS
jgi:hypothetical protein